MKIVNLSKGKVIAEKFRTAGSFLEKNRGLLHDGAPNSLFLKTRWGIHTFGMKFPIDCVVCDKNLKVVSIRQNIAPGTFFFWWPVYKNILELPAGMVSLTGTEVGDSLAFRF